MLQRNGNRQRLLFVLFTMAAVGCATMGSTKPIPLAANDMAWLRDQSEIVLIHHQTPQPFRIWKTDYLAPFWEGLGYPFALIAVERRREEAIREGEQIRTRYSVADPVLGAKTRFEYELRSKLGFTRLRAVSQPVAAYNPYQLADSFGSVMALDFMTSSWMLSSITVNPLTTHQYQLRYAVQARLLQLEASKYRGEPKPEAVAQLLRSEDSKIMWQGICYATAGGTPYTTSDTSELLSIPEAFVGTQSYTLEEWTANNATLLTEKLNEAADACARALLANFSG